MTTTEASDDQPDVPDEPDTPDEPQAPEPVMDDGSSTWPDAEAYEQLASRYGTGILPAAVWADGMGHPAPDMDAFARAGVPAGPITWQQYVTGREATEESAR